MKKSSQEDFLKKAKVKHGNKFNYDKAVYVNSLTKVILTCENNHEFTVRPDMHINRGDGCPICRNNQRTKSNEKFLEEIKKICSDKYDFSLVDYKGVYQKVTLICKEHGQFQITPNSISKCHSCPSCNTYNKMNSEQFIEKAKKIHNNKYIYDHRFRYINSRNNVEILCPKHGYFQQLANNHLRGHACNKCENRSKSEIIIENILISKSINFKIEYKFFDLRYIYPLRFDFAIFDDENNLKYLLEFNGRQHYEFVRKFHVEEKNFEIYKERDKIKMDYCEKNNIKVFIIKYNDDIEKELEKIINENEENSKN
jgi:hypothetical protein